MAVVINKDLFDTTIFDINRLTYKTDWLTYYKTGWTNTYAPETVTNTAADNEPVTKTIYYPQGAPVEAFGGAAGFAGEPGPGYVNFKYDVAFLDKLDARIIVIEEAAKAKPPEEKIEEKEVDLDEELEID